LKYTFAQLFIIASIYVKREKEFYFLLQCAILFTINTLYQRENNVSSVIFLATLKTKVINISINESQYLFVKKYLERIDDCWIDDVEMMLFVLNVFR